MKEDRLYERDLVKKKIQDLTEKELLQRILIYLRAIEFSVLAIICYLAYKFFSEM